MLELKGTIRESRKKVAADAMPAVMYGKATKAEPITLNKAAFEKVLDEAGESTVVMLKTDTGEHEALIHDVQVDVITGEPVHADFYVFEKGKKLEVEVPLEFTGESPAVEDLGGILVKVIYDLPIEAEPRNLPQEIVVDITSLVDFDSVIVAKDLSLPEGVELAVDPEEVIASISEPREEEEEDPDSGDVDMDAIEVEGAKGGEDEEGSEGGAEGSDEDKK